MKSIFVVFAVIALIFNAKALVLPNSILGINIFNNTQNAGITSAPVAIPSIPQVPANNNNPNVNNGGGTGGCYAVYAQSLYQTLVVGGAKLRFCAQNAAKDVAASATVSQCVESELFNISAQMNLAADNFTICLTAAAL